MPVQMDPEEFDACVDDALASIPNDLAALIENCIVEVVDEAPDDDPDLLGLYEGIPLQDRGFDYTGVLPDVVSIFRNNLMDMCADRDDLIEEIRITVVHELAHHFGIDDDRLAELGYD